MPRDEIILELNGLNYSGWKSVSAQRTMESLCGSFTIQLVDVTGTITDDITEGSASKLYIQDGTTSVLSQIYNSYIDGVKNKITAKNATMTVQGRDVTMDLIDCAAIQKSSTWVKAKFSRIVTDICDPFSIVVDTSQLTSDETIEKFTLQNGDTAFEAIERLCRSQAVLPLTDVEGNLLLTYAADFTTTADEDLELGKNILEVEREANWKERFSAYTIRGQRSGNGKAWDGRITQMVQQATD
jgi:prophage tail gpP-like protein